MEIDPKVQAAFDASFLPPKRRGIARRAAGKLGLFRDVAPDPASPVRWDWEGGSLTLPFSHALPRTMAIVPGYSQNLPRLARLVQSRYPGSGIIDIGANVGDTAFFLHHMTTAPVLCIEGNPDYLPFLEANTAGFENVEVEPSFVGESDETIAGQISEIAGTARITGGDGAVSTRTLESVLESHPRFSGAKLVKTDTDGFDTKILRGAASVLERLRPVLFFEYDPQYMQEQGEDGRAFLGMLAGLGYDTLLVYDSRSDLMFRSEPTSSVMDDIHDYFSGRANMMYADIAAFHACDADLVEEAYRSERAYFHSARGF